MTTYKVNLLINNIDVESDSYLAITDPGRTKDVVGHIAQASTSQAADAVQAAHEAFHKWKRTPIQERIGLLEKAAKILDDEAGEIAPIMARESGMLVSTSEAEIKIGANIIRDNAELAGPFLQSKYIEDEISWVSIEKRPIGVVVGIVSWNAPVVLTMRKLAPALVCGNTIVIKPSPTAAIGISMLLKKIAALFPPGVINVVHGEADVGTVLTTHPHVRKVSFTGGGKVATTIMRNAAEGMKNVQFELGGNDPAIILDDVNIDEAIAKVTAGIFRRAGQFCFAIKRVYVPESIYDRFFEKLENEINKFVVGHPLDPLTTFGPINNRAQWQFLKQLLERTRAAGAEVVELGKWTRDDIVNEGYYLRPTVIKNADPASEIVTTEQFGPIIPVIRYSTEDEALQMANQSELGLGSSVWSTNHQRAMNFARQIEAGMTFINQSGASRLGQRHIPFGGVKQSGIGRESSEIGLAEYIEYHSINGHTR